MLIIYKVFFFTFFFLFFQIFTFGPFHRVVLEVDYQEILANLFSIFSYQSCKHFFVLFSYYLYFFFFAKVGYTVACNHPIFLNYNPLPKGQLAYTIDGSTHEIQGIGDITIVLSKELFLKYTTYPTSNVTYFQLNS
jgi:hypothetical protein